MESLDFQGDGWKPEYKGRGNFPGMCLGYDPLSHLIMVSFLSQQFVVGRFGGGSECLGRSKRRTSHHSSGVGWSKGYLQYIT